MKKFISIVLTALVLCTSIPFSVSAEETAEWSDTAATAFAGGSGTEADPYLIASGAELALLANHVWNAEATSGIAQATGTTDVYNVYTDTYFKLTADIDLGGREWLPIGRYARAFNGHFDGGGHIIGNASITKQYLSIGFFGRLGRDASVENLGLEDARIVFSNASTAPLDQETSGLDRTQAVGAFAGFVGGGTVRNCFVRDAYIQNTADRSENYAGGFIGVGWSTEPHDTSVEYKNNFTSIENCYVMNPTVLGSVNASHSGFIGRNAHNADTYRCTITFDNCYVGGNVTLTENAQGYTFGFGRKRHASTVNRVYSVSDYGMSHAETLLTTVSTKDEIVSAMVGSGYVKDKENKNEGYPVLLWEADWLWDGTAATAFAGGSGTEADPYLIASGAELALLANHVWNAEATSGIAQATGTTDVYNVYTDTYFKLTADIDLGGREWLPIGRYARTFNGHFDGGGHVISNVSVTKQYIAIGFFGRLGRDASVEKLGLENVNIVFSNASNTPLDKETSGLDRTQAVGSFSGIIGGGTIKNCFVRDAYLENTKKDRSENYEGGFIGQGWSTELHDTGSYQYNRTYIENCYVMNPKVLGSVNASHSGFIGRTAYNDKYRCQVQFTNCYVGGNVTLTENNNGYTFGFGQSRWSMDQVTSGNNHSISNYGIGRDDTLLTTASTKDEIVSAMVDWTKYWADNDAGNINYGYPVLAWEASWEKPNPINMLTFQMISNGQRKNEITANLNLIGEITSGGATDTLTWHSSDASVIAVEGTVGKVGNPLLDTRVTLTATADGKESSKTFEVTVLGALTRAFDAALNGQERYRISENLTLPALISSDADPLPAPVSWSTSDERYLAKDGTVTRPTIDTPITVYANIYSKRYAYDVVVLAKRVGEYVYETFDTIPEGTSVTSLDNWTNPVPVGQEGVTYSVETDPTEEYNRAFRTHRYWLDHRRDEDTGERWENADTGKIDNGSGPSAFDTALYTLPQAVTSGRIQMSARIMFTSEEADTKQKIGFFIKGLYTQNYDNNNLFWVEKIGTARLWANDNDKNPDCRYLYTGELEANKWYHISFVFDLDANQYRFSCMNAPILRQYSSHYMETYNGTAFANAITAIGMISPRRDDVVWDGASEWYIDDFTLSNVTLTDEEFAQSDLDSISLPSTADSKLNLPTAGENGSTITWSSEGNIIAGDGTLTFATTERTVNLTATAVYKGATATKEFTVTIPAKRHYSVKGLVVEKDGEEAAALVSGGRITAVKAVNYIATENADMYIGLYHNDELVGACKQSLSGVSPSEEVQTFTLSNPILLGEGAEDYEARVFLWTPDLAPIGAVYSTAMMPETQLFVLGDSIAADYQETQYPMTGWGTQIGNYLSDKVTVRNHAHGGFTTASYLPEGSYDSLDHFIDDVNAGDYALISLAINDSSRLTLEEYKENYQTIAKAFTDKGATPILVTSINRVSGNQVKTDLKDRADAVKAVAEELNLICIDVNGRMYSDFLAMEAEHSDYRDKSGKTGGAEYIKDQYFMWDLVENLWITQEKYDANRFSNDFTHLNLDGANYVAALTTELLKQSESPLGLYVK